MPGAELYPKEPVMPRTLPARWARGALIACLIAAALLGAAPARAADLTPDLSLRLWTTPTRAARGDVVSYEILLDNNGRVRADRVRVTLPFSDHMKVIRTEFDHRATWVSSLGQDTLTVMFGRLNGGEDRRAKIFFEIGPDAPDGMQLRVRAVARYEGDQDEKVRSNYTTLAVGGQENDTAPQVTVEPAAAPAGTRLTFHVHNYFPDEKIFTWINAAAGVLESDLAGVAGEDGDTALALNTGKLKPGAYSLVVYGESSTITTVVPFTLQ
jgi:hypothetical protein